MQRRREDVVYKYTCHYRELTQRSQRRRVRKEINDSNFHVLDPCFKKTLENFATSASLRTLR